MFPVLMMLHSDCTEQTFGFLAWRLSKYFGSELRIGRKFGMVQGAPCSAEIEDFPSEHNFNIIKTDGDKALQVTFMVETDSCHWYRPYRLVTIPF